MTEQEFAQAAQLQSAAKDIAAIVAEGMLGAAERNGDFGLPVIVEGFAGLLASAYNLACLGGEDGKIAYVLFLRKHADAVEHSL